MKHNRVVRLLLMLPFLLVPAFLILTPVSSKSQALQDSKVYMPILTRPLPEQWIKHYIASSDGVINDLEVDNNDESLLAGWVWGVSGTGPDGIIIRVQRSGQPLWKKGYGGNHSDYLYKLAPANDGGYWAAGRLGVANQLIYPWVLRLDGDGNILWQKTYVPPPSTSGVLIQDIIATLDGGALMTMTGSGNVVWIVKLTGDGSISWIRFFGETFDPRSITRVQQTPDGAYILAGTGFSVLSDEDRLWAVKLNTDGTVAWQRMVSLWQATGPIYNVFGLEPMSDGSYLVGVGASYHLGGSARSLWFLRFNSDGDFFWQKMFDAGENTAARMTVTANDSVFVTVAGFPPGGGSNLRPWIFKFNSNGVLTWQYFYRGVLNYAGMALGYAVKETSTGDLLVAGSEVYQTHFEQSMLLMHLTDQGTIPACTLFENVTIPSFTILAFVEEINDSGQGSASLTVAAANGSSWNMAVQTDTICTGSTAAASTCLEP